MKKEIEKKKLMKERRKIWKKRQIKSGKRAMGNINWRNKDRKEMEEINE